MVDKVVGVILGDGSQIVLCFVVLMIGIFLCGVIYIGDVLWLGGCMGDKLFVVLVEWLDGYGLLMGCLKIGMLLCFDGWIIDWFDLVMQFGDDDLVLFLFMFKGVIVKQIFCGIMYINEKMYDLICENLVCFVMYGGYIEGVGFCYCFLIEDKVVCFVDKIFYQVFFEFEGGDDLIIYLNGILILLF